MYSCDNSSEWKEGSASWYIWSDSCNWVQCPLISLLCRFLQYVLMEGKRKKECLIL